MNASSIQPTEPQGQDLTQIITQSSSSAPLQGGDQVSATTNAQAPAVATIENGAGEDAITEDQLKAALIRYDAKFETLGMDELIVSVRRPYKHEKRKGASVVFIVPSKENHPAMSADSIDGLCDKVHKYVESSEERKAKRVESLKAELAQLEGKDVQP